MSIMEYLLLYMSSKLDTLLERAFANITAAKASVSTSKIIGSAIIKCTESSNSRVNSRNPSLNSIESEGIAKVNVLPKSTIRDKTIISSLSKQLDDEKHHSLSNIAEKTILEYQEWLADNTVIKKYNKRAVQQFPSFFTGEEVAPFSDSSMSDMSRTTSVTKSELGSPSQSKYTSVHRDVKSVRFSDTKNSCKDVLSNPLVMRRKQLGVLKPILTQPSNQSDMESLINGFDNIKCDQYVEDGWTII